MSELKGKRLFLLDGMALAYRSFFAFIRNPLINSKGMNTSGIFGFTNTLLKILRDENPDYIAVVFDTSVPTFRHKQFPEYKATRERMPDELRHQIPMMRDMVKAFNIPLLEKDGYEADDVMGTLAKQAEAAGMQVYLVSGDKDLMQLVSDQVCMIGFARGNTNEVQTIGIQGVQKKFGVKPEKVIDVLGLMGDSSDNVPGVPGVGPKTALNLILQYGNLESVLNHAEDVKRQNVRENLIAFREQALLSKELVTIDVNVPVDTPIESLIRSEMNQDEVKFLFQAYEFNQLLSQIDYSEPSESQAVKREYHTPATLAELDDFILKLSQQTMFALDLETTAISPVGAEIVGLSFSWEPGVAWYVPLRCPDSELFPELELSEAQIPDAVLGRLKPVLLDPKIKKCGQNIKYDWLVLKQAGIDLQGVTFDTMVAAYLINPSARRFNLDALALEYFNLTKIPTEAIIGKGRKQICMDQVPLDQVAEYACEDADVTWRLMQVLAPRLKENEIEDLFQDVEVPLIQVLLEMEENGVALDVPFLREMSAKMDNQLIDLENTIYEMAGERFNIKSTQQLGHILFEKLKVHELVGLKRAKRTKTGYATDVKVLESLSVHPLPQKLLDYRQLIKLKSTYIDALPKLINPKTKRVHASFNQTVAATGRLSTSDPNLQNIPIRTDIGREIRKAFIPGREHYYMVSADYSQIELRIMAHISGDETLLESFRKDEDVHKRTASEIFEVPQNEVTADHRRMAKTINFGIIYGMGQYGLANRLQISTDEAQQFIHAYFARYPKVNAFMSQIIAQAYDKGYVTTLMNRRRYLPELNSDNRSLREMAERTAINTPIQGTAADLIKVAMIRIARRLREEDWQACMILQIHDELLFEVHQNQTDQLADMVRQEMEGAIKLNVPIKVDVGIGQNWYEAH